MLKFTFEDQTIDVDLEKLGLHEGLALQKVTGWRMPVFMEAIKETDFQALVALAWVLIKFRIGRDDVTFDDVAEGRVVVDISAFENPDVPTGDAPPTGAGAATTPN